MAKHGNRLFALFDLKGETPDYDLVFGLRNSHDKTFPAALSLGARVFVCDNLSFSGEVSIARRHTRHIERDLPALVAKATAALIDQRNVTHRRIETYKSIEFTNPQAHDLIVRAAQMKLMPASNILDIAQEWVRPTHEEFAPRTGWSLWNAFTEIGKTWGNSLPARTARIHGLFDAACGLTTTLAALQNEENEDVAVTLN